MSAPPVVLAKAVDAESEKPLSDPESKRAVVAATPSTKAQQLYQSLLRETSTNMRQRLAHELKGLADSGSAQALGIVATLHMFGFNAMKIDVEQARQSAEKALAAGNKSVVHLLARYHRGIKNGKAKAREVLKFGAADDPFVVYQLLRLEESVDKAAADSALKQLQRMATQGDPIAQFCFGAALDVGRGIDKDAKAAVRWWIRAAEQGHAAAQNSLGNAFRDGSGVELDFKVAARWYQLAAEQGHAPSQYSLAVAFDEGCGTEQDFRVAANWFCKAAEQGAAVAQYEFACALRDGKGVEVDANASVHWFRKAAEQGHAEAQYCLGEVLYSGNGVEQDLKAAAIWFRKAAEAGHVDAQLAWAYALDFGEGTETDPAAAVEWYRKAAEHNHLEAQWRLANALAKGRGVTADATAAVSWFRKAAEQDDVTAQHDLGLCFLRGFGVQQDFKAAVSWFRKAAEQGDSSAQANLGMAYRDGRGVDRDLVQAVEFLRKSSEQGNEFAQLHLACLLRDQGHMEDAAALFRKAAEQGDGSAQLELASALRDGRGVEKDEKSALEYYLRASAQGKKDAGRQLCAMIVGDEKRDVASALVLLERAMTEGKMSAAKVAKACMRNLPLFWALFDKHRIDTALVFGSQPLKLKSFPPESIPFLRQFLATSGVSVNNVARRVLAHCDQSLVLAQFLLEEGWSKFDSGHARPWWGTGLSQSVGELEQTHEWLRNELAPLTGFSRPLAQLILGFLPWWRVFEDRRAQYLELSPEENRLYSDASNHLDQNVLVETAAAPPPPPAFDWKHLPPEYFGSKEVELMSAFNTRPPDLKPTASAAPPVADFQPALSVRQQKRRLRKRIK